MNAFFVSDLHGWENRYLALIRSIREEMPDVVLLGGDLFPNSFSSQQADFLQDFLYPAFAELRADLGEDFPRVFLILGNDDNKTDQDDLLRLEQEQGIWEYIHNRSVALGEFLLFGYNYVPPTPFLNKDWERYDISRFVDPGSISPEDGWHSLPEPKNKIEHATIKEDLDQLTADLDLSRSIFLFHTPPYQTDLDRAALDGKTIDHVPLDVHVGSIAVKEFILKRQPLLTLHGHVHESTRITGVWKQKLGRTVAISAAHGGPELALVRFDPNHPITATRELIE